MTTPATPVAREGARKLAHEFTECEGAGLYLNRDRDDLEHMEHGPACTRLTAAIEARDASAVEVERVLVEALKPFAVAEAEPNRCGCCHWLLEKCIDENCRGFHARAALARVASLRGGR